MVATNGGMIQVTRRTAFDTEKVYKDPAELARLLAKLFDAIDLSHMREFRPLMDRLSYGHFDPGRYPEWAAAQARDDEVAYQFRPGTSANMIDARNAQTLEQHGIRLLRSTVPTWTTLRDDTLRLLHEFDVEYWFVSQNGNLYWVKVSYGPPYGGRDDFYQQRTDVTFVSKNVHVIETAWDDTRFVAALADIPQSERAQRLLEVVGSFLRTTRESLGHQMEAVALYLNRVQAAQAALSSLAWSELVTRGD